LASVGLDFARPSFFPSTSETAAPIAIQVNPPPWRDEVHAAEGYGEAGRWQEAAEAYAAAFAAGNRSPRDWARHGLVLLRLGRTEEYAQISQAMTRHLGTDVNPSLANGLAWACAVGPGAVDAVAVRLAESSGPGDGHSRLNTLGAVYYRAGRFEEAESVLNRSLAAHGSGGAPEDWIFLALTCHQRGRHEEARAWLERLNASGPTTGAAGTWAAVLERRLLEEEARDVVGRES
jgi:tetratricopeptide (TPR) repeat protein